MKRKKTYREIVTERKKQVAKKQALKMSRVCFKITANTGNDLKLISARYKELAKALNCENYVEIAEWIDSLFSTRGAFKSENIKWESTSSLCIDQVREEFRDTSHAKNLPFTREGDDDELALNNPLFYFKAPNGKKILVIGVHRHYKCQKVLKVDQVPCVEISPSLVTLVGQEAIFDFARVDNSVEFNAKRSSLSDDGKTVHSMFKSWLLMQPECKGKSQIENDNFLDEVLRHPSICKEEFPEYWDKLYRIAKIVSSVHGAKKIRSQVFLAHDKGFSPYLNGKIDQIRESLLETFERVKEPGEKESSTFKQKNTNDTFSIVLCDGGQQQEQAFLRRLANKRLEKPSQRVFGVVAGVGSSKAAILQTKISFAQLFLSSVALVGIDTISKYIEELYRDGFYLYPQFIEGLDKLEISCGTKKYLVSCDKEDASDFSDWRHIPVQDLIAFLHNHVKNHPGEWVLNEITDDLWNMVAPKNAILEEVETKIKAA